MSQLKQIVQVMERFKLDTLLEKQRLHVLTLPADEDLDIKIVFSKNLLMGFIFEEKFFVRPEFFKGGSHFNVFMEQEIDMIIKTYQLTGAEALPLNPALFAKYERLAELDKLADKEISLEKLDAMQSEAEDLALEIKTDQATKMFNRISKKYNEVFDAAKPNEAELQIRLDQIVQKVKTEKDASFLQELMAEGQEIIKKLPENESTKMAANVITKRLNEFKSGSAKTETQEDKDKQYLKLIAAGDDAFDNEELDPAAEKYNEALKLKPGAKHPTRQLEKIEKINRKK